MSEFKLKSRIRALQHFLLNKKRPIGSVIFSYRKTKFHLFLQLLKCLGRHTSLNIQRYHTIEDEIFGIASSQNQLNVLVARKLNSIYFLGRALPNSDSGKITYVRINTFYFLFNFIIIFVKLRGTRFISYVDILTLMHCYDTILKAKNANVNEVYVSNLNSPLISNFIRQFCLNEKVIHIPHAVLGASCIPDLRLCRIYYCWGEYEKEKFKHNTKVKIMYRDKPSKFKRSHSGFVNLVLPKEISKVRFAPSNDEHLLLKFHPGSRFLDIFWLKVRLWRKRIKFTVVKDIDIRFRVYSVSTTAILNILKQGKCVYLLQSKDLKDHYDMSDFLFTSEEESYENYVNQLQNLSVYDASLCKL